ncbi:MAG: phosphatase PAP2 family protein, partial [Verrucomicrobiota bacterium]
LAAQEWIYRISGESWSNGERGFWDVLYRYGTIPATIVVLLAIIGYVLSWSRPAFRRWRQVLLFLVMVAVVGPGIITNAGLKEYWGRPRPREVEGLGGHSAFERVLTIDRSSDGKSFPCGHATMGYFFIAGFFLLRRHRRSLAELFLIGGLAAGFFMGIARMAQGAHFFSDVIWAGAVCYFSAMGLYYAMGLHRQLARRGLAKRKMPVWLRIVSGSAAVGLLGAVLLASPYRDARNLFVVNEFAKSGPLEILLILTLGEVDIVGAEKFRITGEAYGHGVPTSKIGEHYVEHDRGDYSAIWYKERLSGFLTEVNEQLKVELPWERVRKLKMETAEANLWIDLAEVAGQTRIQLMSGSGTIRFQRAQTGLRLIGGENAEILGEERYLSEGGQSKVRVIIGPQFIGKIIVE